MGEVFFLVEMFFSERIRISEFAVEEKRALARHPGNGVGAAPAEDDEL